MRRRDLLLTTLVVPLLPTSTPAQAQEKVWHVSVLTPQSLWGKHNRHFTLPVFEAIRSAGPDARQIASSTVDQ